MTRADGCGDQCRYRRLYEGSQESLRDLTEKHTHAVRQHRRLRTELVRLMRRIWPALADDVERGAGDRLDNLGDEHLLVHLATFVDALRDTEEHLDGVIELRRALQVAGYELPRADDLSAWANAIYHHQLADEADTTPPTPEFNEHDDEPPPAAEPAVRPRTPEAPAEQPPATLPPPEPPDDEGAPPAPSHTPAQTRRASDVLSELFASPPAPEATPSPAPEPVREPAAEPEADAGASSEKAAAPTGMEALAEALGGDIPKATEAPFKPNTSGGSRGGKSKERRKPRVQATPPGGGPEPAPAADAADHDDASAARSALERLTAAVAVPRPVFVSDLVEVAGGDSALVQQWETEQVEAYPDSPVRLLSGKARHRLRGALVIPQPSLQQQADGFEGSWWQQAIASYGRGRLYELAVLLAAVGDDVVAYEFGQEVATVRLHQASGPVGIVVVFGSELSDGGATREALDAAVGGFVKERLSLLAVLYARGDIGEDVARAVRDSAEAHRWQPAMPVVSAASWQWADRGGDAATVLLTG